MGCKAGLGNQPRFCFSPSTQRRSVGGGECGQNKVGRVLGQFVHGAFAGGDCEDAGVDGARAGDVARGVANDENFAGS